MDKGNSAQATRNNKQETLECLHMGGLSQRCLCKELKRSLSSLVILMNVPGQTVKRLSKSTTLTGKRGNTLHKISVHKYPCALSKRQVVQGRGKEALIHRPLPCCRKPKRQRISWEARSLALTSLSH